MDEDKRAAALAALDEVRLGMLIGLGTGSTAAFTIAALGERVRAGLDVRAVGTSLATEAAARAVGITILDFADIATVNLTIDGADEIDGRLFAIKGGGGAMLREKIVAAASQRMVVIADGSKRVAAIGAKPVPVEVLPFALASVTRHLEALGASVTLRMAGPAPFLTDNGNHILDCRFAALPDPRALAAALDAIPGALGHGLFLDQVAAAYIATNGQVVRIERSA